jgi:hypothetical protein
MMFRAAGLARPRESGVYGRGEDVSQPYAGLAAVMTLTQAEPMKAGFKALRRLFSPKAPSPAVKEALLAQVLAALETGDSVQVIAACEAMLKAAPNAGKGYVWIAEAMVDAPPSPAQLSWLDKLAEKHAPPPAFEPMALLHAAHGDPARSRAWFRRHVMSPALKDAKGMALEGHHDFIASYIEALEERPPGPDLEARELKLLELLIEAGRPERARRQAERMASGPASPELERMRASLEGRPAPPPAPADPLSVMVWERHRKPLLSSIFLRRFARLDLGEHMLPRLFRADAPERGWAHVVYCGVTDRVTPRGRDIPAGYFLFDWIPRAVLDRIRGGEGRLVIDHGNEGWFVRPRTDQAHYLELLQHLDAERLPADRVLIVDGNLRSPALAVEAAQGAGLPGPRLISALHGALDLAGVHMRKPPSEEPLAERLDRAARTVVAGDRRSRHFLSFNHAPRTHRCAMLGRLLERRLLDRGLVSFAGPHYQRHRNKPGLTDGSWVRTAAGDIRSLVELADPERTMGVLAAMSPIEVDTPLMGAAAKALAFGANKAWPYQDSYLSIVTETQFSDGRTLMITEKMLHPILNLHPFIVVGDPGILAELRRQGFRTFDPMVDEGYDDIFDPRERMAAALAEIERLVGGPIERMHELYCECWPILEHNARHVTTWAQQAGAQALAEIQAAVASA